MLKYTVFLWFFLTSFVGLTQGHLSLDGVDDILISQDTLLPNGDATVECFIQVCDSANKQSMALISTDEVQCLLKPDTNGQSALLIHHPNYERTVFLNPIQQSKWTHLALTYREVDSTIRMFFNGLFVDTYQKQLTRSKGFVVGDSSNSFQGKIDELRVSRGVLYASQANVPYDTLAKSINSYLLFNFSDTLSSTFRDAVAQKELHMANGQVFQPTPTVSSDSVVCAGTPLRLNAKGGHRFYWQPDPAISLYDVQGASTSVEGPLVFAAIRDTGTVVCRMVDTNNCETTINHLISPLPQPSFSLGNDTLFCEADSFSIDIPGFKNYVWSNGDSTSDNHIGQTGWYWLEVTDSNSCSFRDSLFATAIPSPEVNLGNDTILEAGHTMHLDAGTGFASYRWNTAETTQRILVTLSKEYFVTVTDTNGCTGIDQILVYINDVSTEEFDGEKSFRLFPNPAVNSFLVSHQMNGEVTLRVTDLRGVTLLTKTVSNGAIEIDVDNWPKGVCFVSLGNENGLVIKRLLIK